MTNHAPLTGLRVLLAALLAGYACWSVTQRFHGAPEFLGRDFTQLWLAARDVLAGVSPYRAIRPQVAYPLQGYFPYPLPAALVVVPFTVVPVIPAAITFITIGVGAYSYALSRRHLGIAVAAYVSACMLMALRLAQTAPLVLAGYAVAPLSAIGIMKPNLGLAVLAARPNWWTIGGGIVLGGAALLLQPTWPADWFRHLGQMTFYSPPLAVLAGGGPLLLLSALRWRTPEGRLLLMLAILPVNFLWYDQLALFFVAHTLPQAAVLLAASWVSYFISSAILPDGLSEPAKQLHFRAPIVAMMYLPALVIVLRRPNEGTVPARLERAISRAPAWLRGKPPVDQPETRSLA